MFTRTETHSVAGLAQRVLAGLAVSGSRSIAAISAIEARNLSESRTLGEVRDLP
jgi:hypothetical protein